MKITVKKEVKQYVNEELEITGATLLSIEEAEKLPIELRKYNCWWWLLSSDNNFLRAPIVNYDGTPRRNGDFVEHRDNVVRPALQIENMQFSNLKIGDIFEFGGKPFKIITDELAFCLSDIGTCKFRKDWKSKDANDYEKSDVKKYVDDWFNNVSA